MESEKVMPTHYESGQLFRHYKGKMYRYLRIFRHSETLEELVGYEALYDNELGRFWVRPREMFFGRLEDGRLRFEPVSGDSA
jgi:hypothetical protein